MTKETIDKKNAALKRTVNNRLKLFATMLEFTDLNPIQVKYITMTDFVDLLDTISINPRRQTEYKILRNAFVNYYDYHIDRKRNAKHSKMLFPKYIQLDWNNITTTSCQRQNGFTYKVVRLAEDLGYTAAVAKMAGLVELDLDKADKEVADKYKRLRGMVDKHAA